jgi:hypothetical protein
LISIPKENNDDREEEAEATILDTSKDIIKGMDRYQAKMKPDAEGEHPPAGDSTRPQL